MAFVGLVLVRVNRGAYFRILPDSAKQRLGVLLVA